MENKEKVQEAIKQTESKMSQLGIELANLKAELDNPEIVEIAADGAILVGGKKGYFVRGDGRVENDTFPAENSDVEQLSSYATLQQAQDEVLRREISCYLRRRACELNDNHDWRKVHRKAQYGILLAITGSNITPTFDTDYNVDYSMICAYFNKKEQAEAVSDELNAKYSPETIKRLYYTEEK